MNMIHLMGRLGAKPEKRVTPNGNKLTSFTLACNTRRGGKEETMWYKVTVWTSDFDKIIEYFDKGTAVVVVGELGKPETYTNKEGVTQISLPVTARYLGFSPYGRDERESNNSMGYSQPFKGGLMETEYGNGFATSDSYRGVDNDNDSMPF